jgi:hypothetical protein
MTSVQVLSPRELVEEIRTKQLTADKEFVLDSLSGAIDRLEKAFPRYGSFVMEFIQNADDARSTQLRIEITENDVKFANTGEPFTDINVKSIWLPRCRVQIFVSHI